MCKILFVLPSITQANGVASFLINYLKKMDLDNFKVTILASDLRPSQEYVNFFQEKNIKVTLLPCLRTNGIRKYIKSLKDFFKKNHDYDIVYSNVINQSLIIFHEAKKYGIKKCIVHAHATVSSDKIIKKAINNILIRLVSSQATLRVACSEAAGVAMYGNKKFEVINNAIDYNKFKYSESNRNIIRNSLKIDEDKIVIGFVGRFAPQKNIDFFYQIAQKLNDKYVFLMIGSGNQKNKFIMKLEENNIIDRFYFIEECEDVYKYYSAMDVFILPSKYEGLPVVSVEAQANGLFCILSDCITKECKILQQTEYLSINNIDEWQKKLNHCVEYNRNSPQLEDKFDIDKQVKNFEKTLLAVNKDN